MSGKSCYPRNKCEGPSLVYSTCSYQVLVLRTQNIHCYYCYFQSITKPVTVREFACGFGGRWHDHCVKTLCWMDIYNSFTYSEEAAKSATMSACGSCNFGPSQTFDPESLQENLSHPNPLPLCNLGVTIRSYHGDCFWSSITFETLPGQWESSNQFHQTDNLPIHLPLLVVTDR